MKYFKYLTLYVALTKDEMFVHSLDNVLPCKIGLIVKNEPQVQLMLDIGTPITKEEFQSTMPNHDDLKDSLYRARYYSEVAIEAIDANVASVETSENLEQT